MPKNIDDIIPPTDRRSIRNIPIPPERERRKNINLIDSMAKREAPKKSTGRRTEHSIPIPVHLAEPTRQSSPTPTPAPLQYESAPKRDYASSLSPRPRHGGPKKSTLLASLAAVVVVVLIVLSFMGGATLAYTPKSAPLNFDGDTFTAEKTGDAGLLYSVVKLSGDKGVAVAATGEEDASVRATGKIIVYNNEAVAQKLLINTRFETPEGKIYKSKEALNVPAKGSVEADVYAAEPGESYNIGLSDFTILGFKGTTRYTTVYARSKTNMTGGFVGKRKTVNAAALAEAKTNLESSLKEDLINQTKAQVPQDFILYPSLATVTYEDLPQSGASDGQVTVNLRGNLYGVMFKKSDLATFIAGKKVSLAPGESLEIPALESLDVQFSGPVPPDLLKSTQVNISVTGSATALWQTDIEALKNDLRGRRKSDVASILTSYPSIASADAIIRPFWKKSFPEEAGEISIKEQKVN